LDSEARGGYLPHIVEEGGIVGNGGEVVCSFVSISEVGLFIRIQIYKNISLKFKKNIKRYKLLKSLLLGCFLDFRVYLVFFY